MAKIFVTTKENLKQLFSNYTTFTGTNLHLHCHRALLRPLLVLLSPMLSVRVLFRVNEGVNIVAGFLKGVVVILRPAALVK